MKNALLWLLSMLVVSGVAAWWLSQPDRDTPYPGMGGDFELQSASGPVTLHQFKGKLLLIYFGYTSCPDVCPTSLGALSAALKQLSAEEQAQLQPLFISVDPERDSVQKLKEYTAYFYPGMIGATARMPYLEQLAKRYGAYFRKAPVDDSTLGYAIDHSSTIYVVDKQGQLMDMIQHSSSPQAIRKQIRENLSATSRRQP